MLPMIVPARLKIKKAVIKMLLIIRYSIKDRLIIDSSIVLI